MRTRNRLLLFLLVFSLLFSAGCSEKEAEKESIFRDPPAETSPEKTVILLTLTEKEGTFTHSCALHFQNVLENSDSSFQVDIYPDNQIGSMELSDKMLYDGRIQVRLGPGPSKLIHLMGLVSISGLSEEGAAKCMEDPDWQELLSEECLPYKTRILGILPPSERVITSTFPLESVSDFQGLRIRGTTSAYSTAIWEPLGCEVKKIALDGAYAALSNQVVDAWADNTIFHYLYYKRYESHPYVTSIKQQIYLEPFYVSEDFYQSLTDDQKLSLEQAVEETITWAEDYRAIWLETRLADMKEAGAVFLELSEDERQKMNELVYPSVYAQMQKNLDDAMIQKACEIVKRYH